MTEIPSQHVIPEPAKKPREASKTTWHLPAKHRHPAVVWLIVLLIVLLAVVAGIAVAEAQKLFDLGGVIEHLENPPTAEPP